MREINIIGATSPLGIDLTRYLIDKGERVRMSYRSEGRVPIYLRECPSVETALLDLNPSTDFAPFLSGTVIWLAHLDQGRFNEREVETNIAVFEQFLNQAKTCEQFRDGRRAERAIDCPDKINVRLVSANKP